VAQAAQAASAQTPKSAPLSEAQLAANRANAQHSTGPRTEEGKAKVSLNAVKIGLTGRTVLLGRRRHRLPSSSPRIRKSFATIGVEERALVQSILDWRWRLDRILGLEMALLTLIRDEWIARDPKYKNPVTAVLTEMQIRRKHEKEFRNLQIPENRLARREKEMAELLRLQKERKASKPKPSPKPASSPLTATNPSISSRLGLNFQLRNLKRTSPLSPPPASNKCFRKP
jgi:hypothetical protein